MNQLQGQLREVIATSSSPPPSPERPSNRQGLFAASPSRYNIVSDTPRGDGAGSRLAERDLAATPVRGNLSQRVNFLDESIAYDGTPVPSSSNRLRDSAGGTGTKDHLSK